MLGIRFENSRLTKTLASALPLPMHKLREKFNNFLGLDFSEVEKKRWMVSSVFKIYKNTWDGVSSPQVFSE